nr:PREDICTED: MATH domain and coiled-coil domain-containing protein At3g58210-like [Daucus carota subsp. sativus]
MVNVIYNYTWKLTHFSELVDDECFSDAFDIGSYKWRLYLKPNGDADNRGCNLSLYVEMMDPPDNSSDEHVKAEFKITLKDQINMKHYIKRGTNWFGPSTLHSWGWGSFIPLKNLHDRAKGFIVEDCCKFEAQITLLCKTHLKPLDS